MKEESWERNDMKAKEETYFLKSDYTQWKKCTGVSK